LAGRWSSSFLGSSRKPPESCFDQGAVPLPLAPQRWVCSNPIDGGRSKPPKAAHDHSHDEHQRQNHGHHHDQRAATAITTESSHAAEDPRKNTPSDHLAIKASRRCRLAEKAPLACANFRFSATINCRPGLFRAKGMPSGSRKVTAPMCFHLAVSVPRSTTATGLVERKTSWMLDPAKTSPRPNIA